MGHAFASLLLFIVAAVAFVNCLLLVMEGDFSTWESILYLFFAIIFVLILFCILPSALAIHFFSMWRSEKRDRILNKIKNKAFLESGASLSWYEQKILGRYVVEKMNSGQLLHEMNEENEYAEDALADMAAQHRPKR